MGEYRLDYLVRRGRRFYFRRAVPPSLIPYLNKSEIKLSLRTDQPDVARRRCRSITNIFERFFENYASMSELPANVINRIIRDYFAEALKSAQVIVRESLGDPFPGIDVEDEITGTEEYIKSLKAELASRNFTSVTKHAAEDETSKAGYPVPGRLTDSFDDLCEGIVRAKIEQCRIYVSMLSGNYDEIEPKDMLFKGSASNVFGQPAEYSPSVQTVGELTVKFISLKSANEWTQKTVADHQRVLDWFKLLVNADLPIASVTKGHVEKFRDLMLSIPKNFEKMPKYKGMTVLEAAEAADPEDKLAPKTADKYVKTMKSFLNWCVEEEYLKSVPGAKVKIAYKAAPQEARNPFTKKQLEILLSSPVYTGCFSPSRRTRPGKQIIRDGMYWIPLIGLFTGMRLGEIVQMHCADIQEENGIWYFDVTTVSQDGSEIAGEENNKTLKTAHSRRRIPVHSILVKAGFLDYLKASIKKKNHGKRLFPEIEKGSDGYYSHNFSKKFSRYLKAMNIKTPKTVFHSLRHNFKDALDAGGVEDSHQDALMGHTDYKMAKNIYGSGKNLKVLQGDMEKISYPVDLSKLYIND